MCIRDRLKLHRPFRVGHQPGLALPPDAQDGPRLAIALGLVGDTQPMVHIVQHRNLEAKVASLLAGSIRYDNLDRRPFDESIQRNAECLLNLSGLGA